MTGALVELVAKGVQDAYLTGKPEVSFFHQQYKRYTNFAQKPVQVNYAGTAGPSQQLSLKILNKGDLLGYIWMDMNPTYINGSTTTLSNIQDTIFELYIGGQLIDRQDGFYMTQLWQKFLADSSAKGFGLNTTGYEIYSGGALSEPGTLITTAAGTFTPGAFTGIPFSINSSTGTPVTSSVTTGVVAATAVAGFTFTSTLSTTPAITGISTTSAAGNMTLATLALNGTFSGGSIAPVLTMSSAGNSGTVAGASITNATGTYNVLAGTILTGSFSGTSTGTNAGTFTNGTFTGGTFAFSGGNLTITNPTFNATVSTVVLACTLTGTIIIPGTVSGATFTYTTGAISGTGSISYTTGTILQSTLVFSTLVCPVLNATSVSIVGFTGGSSTSTTVTPTAGVVASGAITTGGTLTTSTYASGVLGITNISMLIGTTTVSGKVSGTPVSATITSGVFAGLTVTSGTTFSLTGGGSSTSITTITVAGVFIPTSSITNIQNTGTVTNLLASTWVPLHFFFCDACYLPLVALQYHEVEVRVTFGNGFNPVAQPNFYANYIVLDTDERTVIVDKEVDLLIEQVQRITAISSSKIDLSFLNHPVKCLMWGNSAIDVPYNTTVPFTTQGVQIYLNGTELFSTAMPDVYFGFVQNYYHSEFGSSIMGGQTDTVANVTSGFNLKMFSFALKANKHQPCGTCNFSRLDTSSLTFTAAGAPTNLYLYAVNFNILRIKSGMAGLAFSS